MTIELNGSIAEYSSRKKPSTPEDYKKIQDRIDDLYTLTGMDKLRAVYEEGIEIRWEYLWGYHGLMTQSYFFLFLMYEITYVSFYLNDSFKSYFKF